MDDSITNIKGIVEYEIAVHLCINKNSFGLASMHGAENSGDKKSKKVKRA